MIGLTRHQHDLLGYLKRYISESGGIAPSYDEMCEAVGLASKSGVSRIIHALEERGLIRRLPGRARAIEILAPDIALSKVPTDALLAELAKRGHSPLRPNGAALPSGHNLPEPLTAPPAIGGSGPSVEHHHASGITHA